MKKVKKDLKPAFVNPLLRFLLSKKASGKIAELLEFRRTAEEIIQAKEAELKRLTASSRAMEEELDELRTTTMMNQKIIESQEIMMNLAQKNLDKKKADIEKIKKSIDDVRVVLRNLQETFRQIVDIANKLNVSAGTLSDSVLKMRTSTDTTAADIELSFQDLTQLDTEISEMTHFKDFLEDTIKKITEVSEQLKVIQVNGRIEAAHVGRAGEGFSVIMGSVYTIYHQVKELVEQEAAQVKAKVKTLTMLHNHSTELKTRLSGNITTINSAKSIYESLEQVSRDLSGYAEVFLSAMGIFAHEIEMISESLNHISETIDTFTKRMTDDLNY